jgi:hypothetical protein
MRPVAMASSRNNSRNRILFSPIPRSNNRECIALAQPVASLLCSSLMKFPFARLLAQGSPISWPDDCRKYQTSTAAPAQLADFPRWVGDTSVSTRLARPGDNFRHASGKIFSGRRMSDPHLIHRVTIGCECCAKDFKSDHKFSRKSRDSAGKDCGNMTDINLIGTPGTPGVNGTTPGQAGTSGGSGGNATPAQNIGNGIDTLYLPPPENLWAI